MRTILRLAWVPMEFGVARDNGWALPRLLAQFARNELVACKLRDGSREWRRQEREEAWDFEMRIITDLRALVGAETVAAE